MATRKKRKVDEDGVIEFDFAAEFEDTLDSLESQSNVTVGMDDPGAPLSTGSLAMDWVTGGLKPNWYTNAGGEQSAKTTTAIITAIMAVMQGVPFVYFFDYEGSTKSSQDYIMNIARSLGYKGSFESLFGQKDPATNKWLVRPRIRYAPAYSGEQFFDMMHSVLQRLPDKLFLLNRWWYVYEDTKENKARYSDFADASMPRTIGRKGIYVPAKDGNLQALFLTDSYPAMNPSANDDEEANNALAVVARMFSKHLPRVKGRMQPKRVAVLGINQLRDVPMAMYGPSQMEPGGQALKFNSDARVWHTSRALSAVSWTGAKGKGRNEEESSLHGGKDKYRYVHLKAVKNKLAVPEAEAFIRLWVEDSNGIAQGIDPVFDTIWYLRETGQLTMRGRKTIRLKLDKIKLLDDKATQSNVLAWKDLKLWVLGNNKEKSAMSEKAGVKAMDLRKFCFKQMQTGRAKELYAETQKGKASSDEDDD